MILANAVLLRFTRQDRLLPILSLAPKPRDLARLGDGLRLACHRAVVAGVGQTVPLAADLAGAAARLKAVAPHPRSKGADRAVGQFLARDALVLAAVLRDRISLYRQ